MLGDAPRIRTVLADMRKILALQNLLLPAVCSASNVLVTPCSRPLPTASAARAKVYAHVPHQEPLSSDRRQLRCRVRRRDGGRRTGHAGRQCRSASEPQHRQPGDSPPRHPPRPGPRWIPRSSPDAAPTSASPSRRPRRQPPLALSSVPAGLAYTLPAEASGPRAVQLAPGQYVQFTLPKAANAITVRYSIPDAPTGGGITAPLTVSANAGPPRTMTLTSQYSWLYNAYPFSNDPTLTTSIEPDWWTTECGCVPGTGTTFPAPFRPNHFYDEQRLLLGRTYPAGATIRLTAPKNTAASSTVIDLMDSQLVAPPKVDLIAANVLLFGADPTGRKDSAAAIDKAIAFAKKAHLRVYMPPGVYQVNRHIIVDNVTIEGAGNWYTIFKGHQVTLATPAADGSVHTGVGFYGKSAADGGSSQRPPVRIRHRG